MHLRFTLFAVLLSALAFGQATPTLQKTSDPVAAATSPATSLSEDQIRQVIRESADKDMENDKKQRDYTYIERQEVRRLDRKGKVKSTEIKTYDVMQIYGEQVQKLISKDDKPLSAKDAKKEDDKIQKLIGKRKNETEADRAKRLQKQEREHEDNRKFVREVANAYNFRFALLKNFDINLDITDRDYKKFRSDTTIIPLGEARVQQ